MNRQLEAASQQKLPMASRIDSASAAYENATKSDSAIFIWKAFVIKYALLQTAFPDKAAAFLQTYANRSKQQKDSLNLSAAWFEKGKQFRIADQPDSAYYYYNASRLLSEARKDSISTAEKLMNIADLHYVYNDFTAFESTTTEALKFLPNVPKTATDSIFRMIAYNNYGLAYTNLFEYTNALSYYEKAFRLNTNKLYANTILNNMALVYMQNDDYQKAISILSRLPDLEIVKTDPLLRARILDNLGYSQWKSGLRTGILNLLQAFRIREAQQDDFESIASCVHLAKYYKISNPEKAFTFARVAYEKATLLNSTNDRLTALKLLAQLPSSESRKFTDRYISVKDSIDEIRQKAKNQFAKIKYDSKLAIDENLKLKAQQAENQLQIEQQKNAGLIIIIFAMFAVGIAIFVYVKGKAQRRKSVYDTETRIAKQLHDELANDMHQMMALADSQDLANLRNKENLLQKMDAMYHRTRQISKENQDLDTGPLFPIHLKQMIADYNSETVNVISSEIDSIPWEQLSRDKKIAVHRIIQEWLVNMKKHSQSNIVLLKFEKQGSKILISYKDNGIGAHPDQIILKGGLQNVENRIRAIKGTVIFGPGSEKGFQATISFPI